MAYAAKIFIVVVLAAAAAAVYLVFFRGDSSKEISQKVDEIRGLALTQKNCEAALEKANALVERNTEVAEGWHLKGVCEFELGRFDSARASFEKALSFDPNHKAAKNYLEILKAGNVFVGSVKDIDISKLQYGQ